MEMCVSRFDVVTLEPSHAATEARIAFLGNSLHATLASTVCRAPPK